MTKKQLLESYINENLDKIYRFAYSYCKNQQDAEDAVGDSVIKAINSIDSLINEEYLGTWFFRIVANTSLNNLKKNGRSYCVDPTDFEAILGSGEDFTKLSFKEIIEDLEPEHKSIIILKYFEGYSFEDIAKILDININTVKTKLYRTLKLLRLEMEAYNE